MSCGTVGAAGAAYSVSNGASMRVINCTESNTQGVVKSEIGGGSIIIDNGNPLT